MKKVLIITYYWPPSGGGGVMRWLKMSKYLPEQGWQPIIYTPENPDPLIIDDSLLSEVHPDTIELKTNIWEPYDIYRKITGKKDSEKLKAGHISEASSGDWKNRLSVFIRGNFLIPDPRMFWIRPSIKYLTKYLIENPVDLIVSTGPPHSMHLIALGLKKRFSKVKWIADFRDPWTDIDFYDKLKLTKWADKNHKRLEKKVLKKADHIVTVSPGCAKDIEKIAGKTVHIIYNGFDPQDFNFSETIKDNSFTISHFGAFNIDRNPKALWKSLGELAKENKDFASELKIQLIGQTHESITNSIDAEGLTKNLVLVNHLPHREGLLKISTSNILLLPLNDAPNVNGILPGKMFEYMALKRPILAIGPLEADYARVLKKTESGFCHEFNDVQGMKTTIQSIFSYYKKNEQHTYPKSIESFSRKELALEFMNLSEINE